VKRRRPSEIRCHLRMSLTLIPVWSYAGVFIDLCHDRPVAEQAGILLNNLSVIWFSNMTLLH
jgi:hypothetical protein